ncbi:MAG: sarcosine oxidase subunit beta family protein [Alphaproteobacteria bacterium]
MRRYSIFSLARNAMSYHETWSEAWRSPDPKPEYDAIVIGGGGHGLATAYYLAKEHGLTNIAVVERGWLGSGNVARNTTIIRSNYLHEDSAFLYDMALRLWPGLSADLNFNVMFSPRGLINLAHNAAGLTELRRRVTALRLLGIESEMLSVEEIKRRVPALNCSPKAPNPVLGGSWQADAGIARHDAVAWGFARAADARGVDIIQHCEVTGIRRDGGHVVGIDTTRGPIRSRKVGIVTAGHSGVVAGMAGLRLPIQSHTMQSCVSEPIKPVFNTVVMSPALVSLNQSDKGELVIGMGTEEYVGYSQRGSIPHIEYVMQKFVELYPRFARLKIMRKWGGIVDVSADASPIIGKTPVEGLYLNVGWGTGGFKATPGSGWAFAYTMARGEPHPLVARFGLDRFTSGRVIGEHGASGSLERYK